MNLSTTWLGLDLPHPFVPGASPLAEDLDRARRLEDAGAAAIVMPSLFCEQLSLEGMAAWRHLDAHDESFAEALTWFPASPDFGLGPEAYLERLRVIREAVGVPVIASLNGASPGDWLEYAALMEQAGAHALELNLYVVPSDPEVEGAAVEARSLEVVRSVCSSVEIPVAVKLSPFYSSLPSFARALRQAGARGALLFNRFYQPDIDVDELELRPLLQLSHSSELLLRLQWLAILSGRTELELAVTGGVHTGVDAVRALMAGARSVQVVSVLLRHGPAYLEVLRQQLADWLEEHEYDSLSQLAGSMDVARCPDARGWERMSYVRILQSWHG